VSLMPRHSYREERHNKQYACYKSVVDRLGEDGESCEVRGCRVCTVYVYCEGIN
jgi:hypothetical protein